MPIRSKQHMDDVKEGIMHALARCITHKGIADVTIADLIKESGLSAGAIYRHFENKDELLVGVVRHRIKALDEKVVLQELGSFDFWKFVDWTLQRVTTTEHVYLAELEFVSLARVNAKIRGIYIASEKAWEGVLKKCIATLPGAANLMRRADVVQLLIDNLRAIGNQIILRRMIGLKLDAQNYRRQVEMTVAGAFALAGQPAAAPRKAAVRKAVAA
ncbi:MAG TPA: helix-turn-helix domain-containing protein [Nevskiaceae bacterium]|nr:helix-turn-helix domain-containing protein [Nevskiaceae bacterium]